MCNTAISMSQIILTGRSFLRYFPLLSIYVDRSSVVEAEHDSDVVSRYTSSVLHLLRSAYLRVADIRMLETVPAKKFVVFVSLQTVRTIYAASH